MPTTSLTPEDALVRLSELSPGVRAAVVLDAEGRLLAGDDAFAGPAAELVAATEGAAAEVADERGAVYLARSEHHAIVAVATRPALPALMFYDLRAVLEGLEAERA